MRAATRGPGLIRSSDYGGHDQPMNVMSSGEVRVSQSYVQQQQQQQPKVSTNVPTYLNTCIQHPKT